jgi:hypothetical protein
LRGRLDGNAGTHPLSERQRREAALDETIEQSFPASDPPSSDPNPDSPSAITPNVLDDDTEETEGRQWANGMTFRDHIAAVCRSIVLTVLMLVAEAIYLFVEGVLEFTLWFQLRTTPGKAWLLLDRIVTLILAAMI